MKHHKSRKALAVVAAALVTSSLAACSGSTEASEDTVNIGLLLPLSGPYGPPGEDMKDALELYLETSGDKIGGRDVEVSFEDEGADPSKTPKMAEKLIEDDDVDVIMGIGSGETYAAVAPVASKHKVPLLGAGGQLVPKKADMEYLWLTSYLPNEAGEASARYLKDKVDGPVYAIGPDYPGGYEELGGFTKPFLKAGGELANPSGKTKWTPWPDTKDFSKFFDEIAQSDAEAIYAFYAGEPAANFVKAYAKSPASDIPLYGAFITEGPTLTAEGKAAEGVYTVMNYSPDIDNAANRRFTSEWSAEHPERTTNVYSAAGWDCAIVLNQAIGSLDDDQELDSKLLNDAIESLGDVESPRGNWQFSKDRHAPIQKWYMRRVAYDGPNLANVVLEDVDTLGE